MQGGGRAISFQPPVVAESWNSATEEGRVAGFAITSDQCDHREINVTIERAGDSRVNCVATGVELTFVSEGDPALSPDADPSAHYGRHCRRMRAELDSRRGASPDGSSSSRHMASPRVSTDCPLLVCRDAARPRRTGRLRARPPAAEAMR